MITILYEKGIAFVIGKDKNGVIFYRKSPFVDGKYIKVKK